MDNGGERICPTEKGGILGNVSPRQSGASCIVLTVCARFVDLEKAYDWVSQDIVSGAAGECGEGGFFSGQSNPYMHAQSESCVLVLCRKSYSFPVRVGIHLITNPVCDLHGQDIEV